MATVAEPTVQQRLGERDYFTDLAVLKDPYDYFEAVRANGPVHQMEARPDVLVVTGFEEALDILRDDGDWSSANCVQGAAQPLPFTPSGAADITGEIEAHRMGFIGGDSLVCYDDQQHIYSRSILNRLFTPSRLKANEEYITGVADDIIKAMVAKGGCELINEVATPFVTLVIADLLGVPEADRDVFRDVIDAAPPPGNMETAGAHSTDVHPLEFMAGYFVRYLSERRENPSGDILSDLATAKYPDGTTPDLMEVVRLSTFLFGAGQDTSAKLLGNCLRFIVDEPGLQDQLRADPKLIANFIEEVLRMEGSSKITSRLARRPTKIGDLDIEPGQKVLIALSAANRDPRRWPEPQSFKLDRPKAKEHVAFGRGTHVCAGAPLARVEVRIILEKFLEHTSRIDFVEAEHGPPGARTIEYEPSFIIRGVAKMHLVLEPR